MMSMTESEKRAAYLEWINNKTGQNYVDDDSLPAVVELILEKLMELDGQDVNIKSESQGGRSVTFVEDMPGQIKELMNSVRKVKWT
jgi:hypothetical protein